MTSVRLTFSVHLLFTATLVSLASPCSAQTKERILRTQTQAAEVIQSVPKVRDELNSALFRELKRSLPKLQIAGMTYYFVEGDRRITEDQLLFYAAELNHQYATWRSLQSVPEGVRNLIVAQAESRLVSEKEGGRVVRWKPDSTVPYCIMKGSFGNTPQGVARYTQIAQEFHAATQAWSSIENTSVPNFEYRSELDNSPLTAAPNGVTFAVWSVDLPGGVIASAFFPNDPQQDWHVLVDPEAYFGDGLEFDRVGVLRHELGHVLGFRHEHPRSEAPLVCKTLEVFDADVIPLGDYDPISVMHYFCRGFSNPEQQALNEQRRKLMLTPVDVQGVKLIYPPQDAISGFEFLDFNPVRSQPDALPLAGAPQMNAAQALFADSSAADERSEDSHAWQEPQDSTTAINNPDLYAWQLFVALNWPADEANRQADPKLAFGENKTTVWESWKFSSGAMDEVFLADGTDPGPWITDGGIPRRERKVADFERVPLQQKLGLDDKFHAQFDPSTSTNSLNENHLNQGTYQFIRDHQLYNIEGQEALFTDAQTLFKQASQTNRMVHAHEYKLHFPVGAKEVKAQWREIAVEDKSRYRWVEFTDSDDSKLLYGLTALHITTKDLPNWFWATFEHVDNPKRAGAELWQTAMADSAAGPDGYPVDMGIKGTRWENYRLRGTQVDFVDSLGSPTILANSQIESGFQLTSSCITCHARAAIGPRLADQESANRLSIFKTLLPQTDGSFIPIGNVGTLPEGLFIQRTFDNPITGELKYLQLDFVWSLMRARSQSTSPAPDDVSFAQHIRPLFRPKDIESMRSVFDLSKHADVSQHAEAIFARLKDGTMPCDVPWSAANVALFKKWIDDGKKE